MTRTEELLALLRAMEARQSQALDMQTEQLTLARRQMADAQARMEEGLALQKLAVDRQGKALRVLVPAMLVALGCVGWLIVRNAA